MNQILDMTTVAWQPNQIIWAEHLGQLFQIKSKYFINPTRGSYFDAAADSKHT